MYNSNSVTAKTPAKLIISGEHSVLFDQPALAIAINRYTTTTASWHNSAKINFNLGDLGYQESHSVTELQMLAKNLQRNYANYLAGTQSISSVLKRPFELLQYSVANVLQDSELPCGLEVAVNSNVPIGCGMGSSAAVIMSTLYAITNLLHLDWNSEQYSLYSKAIENLQHGISSGLDLHLVQNGGYVRFQNGKVQARNIPNMPLQIINTGQPLSSTGECVSHVAPIFAKDAMLARNFGAVTEMLDMAIISNNFKDFKYGIKLNHELLNSIGVVPSKIVDLIADIEAAGGAAKICGAGAVTGDNSGVVLVASEHNITEIVQRHGYSLQEIQVDTNGTQII